MKKTKIVECINATGRLSESCKYYVQKEQVVDGDLYYTVQERKGKYLPGFFLASRFREVQPKMFVI